MLYSIYFNIFSLFLTTFLSSFLSSTLSSSTTSTSTTSTSLISSSSWFIDQYNDIIDEPEPIHIIGNIPDYINGVLIRLGSSITKSSNKNVTNIYDGLGRVNSWIIEGHTNAAFFQTSMIRSNTYNKSMIENTIDTKVTYEKTIPATKFDGIYSNDNTNLGLYHWKETNSIYFFNNFQYINELELTTLRTIGNVKQNDNITLSSKDLSLSSGQPVEYIHPTTSEVFLINYIILPNEDNNTATLYLYAMGSDMIRNIIGYTMIPYIPGYFPSMTVIDDYALINLNPIELNLTKLTSTSCFTCSLTNNIPIFPSDLFVFSLLNIIPKYHVLEELDFYPLVHVQIPPSDSFYVTQYINGWIENIESDDYPNDEILIVDMCVITDTQKIQMMISNSIPGNIENIMKYPENDPMKHYCDEIKRIELDIPSRILPRHVYQTITTPYYVEPQEKMISNYNLPIIDSKYHMRNIHSVTMNRIYRDNYYCYIYGLTSDESISTTKSKFPNTIVKINICDAEKYFEQNLDLNYPKFSTVVGIFTDETVQLSQPIFVPKPNYDDYSSTLTEDSGTLLVVTKSLIDGKTKLYLINAMTMLVDAMIESPFDLMYDFNGIFVPNEDIFR